MTTGSMRPLIGRGEELAAVRRRFAALGDGPALVGIAGDPGLGTTRLLAEIAAWAARAGAHVCSTTPEALPQALSALPVPTAPTALVTPTTPTTPAAPTAPTAPVVLLVDDVHRCGEEARGALTGLLESPRDGVLLVLGYRPRQCPPGLLAALTAAHPGRHAEHLDLAPLDRAGAEEFAGAAPCARHRATLHQDSGGNPRLLALLTASCEGPGTCPGDAPGAGPFAARRVRNR